MNAQMIADGPVRISAATSIDPVHRGRKLRALKQLWQATRVHRKPEDAGLACPASLRDQPSSCSTSCEARLAG